jgi:[methyl-Co(III) methanol-specific corrinoid protein]:coenzyme M methyltransferase
MSELSPKERLLRTLRKQSVDRPPVICTGGMMNAAIVPVMEKTGQVLPEAHTDATRMTALADAVYAETGFENFGIPFCMTIEAEVLGSEIALGTLACEPKVVKERFASVNQVERFDVKNMLSRGRVGVVVGAAEKLARRQPDVPIIGSLTGPISTAASLVDPLTFLKELRRERDNAHRVLEAVSSFLIEYARALLAHGAAAICIGDPTATGEILGPAMFQDYAVPYLNRIADALHRENGVVIVHICGDMKRVKHLLPQIHSDAISTDALVNLRALKDEYPQLTVMGNLSTYLLQWSATEKIAERTRQLAKERIDIISPACGLSTSTPLRNIQTMTSAVKESQA